MSFSLVGAGLGLLAGLGLATVLVRIPVLRQPSLDDRLAPYLRDAPRGSRLLGGRAPLLPFPAFERVLAPVTPVVASVFASVLAPVLARGVPLLEAVLGGGESVRRRLEQAGSAMDLPEFRVEQLLWGGLAMLVALAGCLLALARGLVSSPLALLVVCLLAGVAGVLARDVSLTRQVRRREQRILAEFPTIAELLALAVAAGEGARGALERVTRLGGGELASELRRALADARSGVPLTQALQDTAARTSLPALARFADGVSVALERGTPLAEVLRAQAGDVREASKRALLEAGGRKEIAMLVPVVFLVLPVTVLFALFPGFLGFTISG